MINFNSRALTIIEVLIASAIIVVVIAGSLSFYLIARSAWMDCSKRVPLQRKASLAMEKMVRGINGRYGIREGRVSTLNRVASDHLEVTVDMDDSPTVEDLRTISFYKSGNQLIYGLDNSVIAEKVDSLIFTLKASDPDDPTAVTDIVIIDLGMQDMVRDRPIRVDLQTEVRCRN